MFFLARYCKLLEETSFRGRTADFFFMLLFGGTLLTLIVVGGGMLTFAAPFADILFLSNSLTFMMVCAYFLWAWMFMVRVVALGKSWTEYIFYWADFWPFDSSSPISDILTVLLGRWTGICVEQAQSSCTDEFPGSFQLYSSLLTLGKLHLQACQLPISCQLLVFVM